MLAVITGATKGIGNAIAKSFAAEGFDIVFCARTLKDVKQAEKEWQKKFPSQKIIGVTCDVSKKSDLQKISKEISGMKKPVDVLVNNAGIFLPGKIMNEKPGTLEKLMEVNVYSAYHLTKIILPAMMKRKCGHIFNICSTASLFAYSNGGSYGISKFAMLGFTKNLREEMIPHNIKVTAVIPGATESASWETVKLPPNRMMPAMDVANMMVVAFKTSPHTVVEEIYMRPMKKDISEDEF
ncbi:MAG: SDR family oxidoreductase [Sphingobacteriales bacterium]|nr:MAG: SDR family oxidoreductase [Sphingobacteriales bacterium]